jgi:hypothetical protein
MWLPTVKDEPATAARIGCDIRGKRPHSGAFLLLVLAVCAMLAVTGCGTSTVPTGTATATGSGGGGNSDDASDSLVMIIRHGEKPSGSTPGVDARGNQDASSLTDVGWNRARRLVDLFNPADGRLRAGLARPTAIYAASANSDGEGARTRETVTPLADKLGIPLDTSFGKGDEKALVNRVISRAGPTLIAWQHGEIPLIAKSFPSVTPTPPAQWPDNRFDVIWTFTRAPDGWHFAQLPELVLPQDQAGVIGN